MPATDNESKKPAISKKLLYGSLAVIALVLGIFLDNDSVASDSNSAINSIKQANIDNKQGEVNIDTAVENSDFNDENLESNEFINNEFANDEFKSYEDNYLEDDMEEEIED